MKSVLWEEKELRFLRNGRQKSAGRQAAEHGTAATVRFYAQKLLDHVFKESSVRAWRNAYQRDADKAMKRR